MKCTQEIISFDDLLASKYCNSGMATNRVADMGFDTHVVDLSWVIVVYI